MHHGKVDSLVADGLRALRGRIDAAGIPSSCLDETLNVATWNIREFGRRARRTAGIHYIAEILGQFDLIGVVELRDNLDDLERVMRILGPYWRVLYSDAILDPGGNRERVAYLYDSRAVVHTGMAATATEPRRKVGLEYLPESSFWRKPFFASFRAGAFDFVVLTTHVRWGSSTEARRAELSRLADWIEAKRESDQRDWIVMGDFNVPRRGDALFQALTRHGLQIPAGLVGAHGTNLAKDKRYDQILHYSVEGAFTDVGGVLDWFVDDAHTPALFPEGIDRRALTLQVSDHLPLWMQVRTDGRRPPVPPPAVPPAAPEPSVARKPKPKPKPRKPIDWSTVPDLGRAYDGVVAARLGVAVHVVAAARRKLGVPAFVGRGRPKGWDTTGLGTVRDQDIADREGLSATTVRDKRKSLGIPGWQRWKSPGRPREQEVPKPQPTPAQVAESRLREWIGARDRSGSEVYLRVRSVSARAAWDKLVATGVVRRRGGGKNRDPWIWELVR